jgi:ketosteroid isomerase-like protein
MSIRDELDVINEAFSRAYSAGDAETVVDFYTDDARLLVGGQPIIRGRAAIEGLFRDAFKDGGATTTFETGEVLAAGGLVVDVGRFVTPTGTGKYVVVYQRGPDGKLRIAVDAASGDGPRPGA